MTAARRVVISFPDHWTDEYATDMEAKLRRIVRRASRLAAVNGGADSGLSYCLVHHGVLDVDQDQPCDFAEVPFPGDQPVCVLRPLLYEVRQ
jgi:hypothetical protein